MRLIICKTKLHQVSQLVNIIHNFLPNPCNEHVWTSAKPEHKKINPNLSLKVQNTNILGKYCERESNQTQVWLWLLSKSKEQYGNQFQNQKKNGEYVTEKVRAKGAHERWAEATSLNKEFQCEWHERVVVRKRMAAARNFWKVCFGCQYCSGALCPPENTHAVSKEYFSSNYFFPPFSNMTNHIM